MKSDLDLHPMMLRVGKAEMVRDRRLCEGWRRSEKREYGYKKDGAPHVVMVPESRAEIGIRDSGFVFAIPEARITNHGRFVIALTSSSSPTAPMTSTLSLMIVLGTPFTLYLRTRSGNSAASTATAEIHGLSAAS